MAQIVTILKFTLVVHFDKQFNWKQLLLIPIPLFAPEWSLQRQLQQLLYLHRPFTDYPLGLAQTAAGKTPPASEAANVRV